MYACDSRWWGVHYDKIKKSKFSGELWTQDIVVPKVYHDVNRIKGLHKAGLSQEKGTIHFGGNGGYQAIGLAYEFGADEVILLGYDMQKTGGKSHWFGDHKGVLNVPSPYDDFIKKFQYLAKDAEKHHLNIINCSTETALTCFKRAELCNLF